MFVRYGARYSVRVNLASFSSPWEAVTRMHINALSLDLKRGCIEFKYYADGIHSGLTPPGNNS